MKIVRKALDIVYGIKILKIFKPLIDAIDAAFFGTDEVTSDAPHIKDGIDVKRYMTAVLIALMPATVASVYFYGVHALLMIMVSYVAGGMTEVIVAIIRKGEVEEGFFVTGLIFPLVLPPTTPLWIVAVGAVFGIFFGKEVFGGTGRNIFNPALVGRLFITIAFPKIMTTFVDPVNAVTTATPLGLYINNAYKVSTPYIDLLLGHTVGGSMGETFRLGIIAGGIFLMFTKVANWRVPVSYLGSVWILSYLGNNFISAKIAPPVFQLLSGGLLYGAFFMATDPVTSPFTRIGKFIFGGFCGLLTVLIRAFAGYVEGVMFSIVIMNSFTPLIDHLVLSVKYGGNKK